MTYAQVVASAKERLRKSGISDFDSDALILFEAAFHIGISDYLTVMKETAPHENLIEFENMLKRRLSHEPTQYIVGEAWFYGRSFYVCRDVLIPRFDTEVLIAEAVLRMSDNDRVLDMCTGSGCIAVTLALEKRGCILAASDISEKAICVAQKNAKRYGVSIDFFCGDLFEQVYGVYDIIVSNPPYIPTNTIKELSGEVSMHEPHLALDGSEDGLEYYRRLAADSGSYLTDGGMLIVEVGCDQGRVVGEILEMNSFCDIKLIKDLSGHDRVVVARHMR